MSSNTIQRLLVIIVLIATIMGLDNTPPVHAEEPIRNPFSFDKAPEPAPPVVTKEVPSKPRYQKPKAPTFEWQLQGIFQTDTGNMALLNYKFVSIGDTLQGWMVIDITAKGVVLKKDKQRLQVLMK